MNTALATNLTSRPGIAADHLRARALLCVTVFLLTGMPRLSVKFGPLPLYVIDLFIALSFYYAFKIRQEKSAALPFTGFIALIALFAVLGELGAATYSGDIVRPVYALARTLLAISLALSVPRIIRTTDDLSMLVRAAALGIGLSALLMIFSSLPGTRTLVASTVFSISWLEPSANAAASYSELTDFGTRGRSLIGVSILTAAFINAFWPLIALSLRLPALQGKWRYVFLFVSLAAPFGVVMSYSRGAILGLILVVVGLLLFGSGRARSGVIAAVMIALVVFSTIGWQSESFYFERVVTRTGAIFTDPHRDEREWERLYAYSEPFSHALDNPEFLLVGEGTSIHKTGVSGEQRGKATHAVFAKAYYSYGMFAAITYILMITSAFLYLLREVSRPRPAGMVSNYFYQALFAGFLGLLSWFMFGHAAVSTPRGAMLLFLFLGLVRSMRNVELWEINSFYRHLYR
jgi:hypothetical protein